MSDESLKSMPPPASIIPKEEAQFVVAPKQASAIPADVADSWGKLIEVMLIVLNNDSWVMEQYKKSDEYEEE